MEKRLLLAFILSFGFISLWSALTPHPQAPNIPVSDLTKNQTNKNGLKIEADLKKPSLIENVPVFEEKFFVLENEKLRVVLTNKGGGISQVFLKQYSFSFPLSDIHTLKDYKNYAFEVIKETDEQVSFLYRNDKIEVKKHYFLSSDDYVVQSEIEIDSADAAIKDKSEIFEGFVMGLSNLEENTYQNGDKGLLEYAVALEKNIYRKANAFKFAPKEEKSFDQKIEWLGFRDRYFCAIIKPQFEVTNVQFVPISELQLEARMLLKQSSILQENLTFFMYFGPQSLKILEGYKNGIEKIMQFNGFSLFNMIAFIIYDLMHGLYNFLPNWGLCIILISVAIYFSMYPLTMKGMMSMKKMQALQPKINKLRERYNNNPQKLNKEMMDLYKEHRINPLGGCLPLILQMPIFIGLYQVLWRSVSFKGAKFLWIKDLSEPDRLLVFPFSIPIIGNELNILPLIMVIIMVFQQKLSTKNMVVSDPQQIMQQKMMTTIFPVFIGFIFYKFASGLALYFTMFYLMSTFTQWKMSKMNVLVQNDGSSNLAKVF
jgi:YidC/Oxa1 family membrane protein insertase